MFDTRTNISSRVTQEGGRFTALLVKKTPFTEAEQQRLADWADGNPVLFLSAAPGLNSQRANAYQAFLSLDDAQEERVAVASAPFDISPVSDDRPFFFRYSFWWRTSSRAIR